MNSANKARIGELGVYRLIADPCADVIDVKCSTASSSSESEG